MRLLLCSVQSTTPCLSVDDAFLQLFLGSRAARWLPGSGSGRADREVWDRDPQSAEHPFLPMQESKLLVLFKVSIAHRRNSWLLQSAVMNNHYEVQKEHC